MITFAGGHLIKLNSFYWKKIEFKKVSFIFRNDVLNLTGMRLKVKPLLGMLVTFYVQGGGCVGGLVTFTFSFGRCCGRLELFVLYASGQTFLSVRRECR